VPGFESYNWQGVIAPAGTPREIIDKLNKAVNEGLNDPKLRARLADLGGAPLIGTPEDFGAIMKAETEKWEKVVKFAGASVEY
jgi:tripartite-type tricarboxylate transporter receptor subunit TctC